MLFSKWSLVPCLLQEVIPGRTAPHTRVCTRKGCIGLDKRYIEPVAFLDAAMLGITAILRAFRQHLGAGDGCEDKLRIRLGPRRL